MLKNTKIFKFYEQVIQEVRKVNWPNKKELISSTSVVLVAVFVSSLVFLFLDYGIHTIVQILLSIGK